jgi:4'-phosphopantetheinyl transferase
MLHIFFIRSEGLLQPEVHARLTDHLPPSFQEEIARYRDPRDRQRSLLGKVLLKRALDSLNLDHYTLEQIQYNSFGRPGFEGDVDFNISHSGIFTVCALGTQGAVGIDVEKIKEVAFGEFEEQFSPEEWAMINTSAVPQRFLFDTWTKKEAFLKSTGTGLSVFASDVIVKGPVITYGNVLRYAQEVPLDPAYVCHVVTAQPGLKATIHPVRVDEL